jgi:hypothetical protein
MQKHLIADAATCEDLCTQGEFFAKKAPKSGQIGVKVKLKNTLQKYRLSPNLKSKSTQVFLVKKCQNKVKFRSVKFKIHCKPKKLYRKCSGV